MNSHTLHQKSICLRVGLTLFFLLIGVCLSQAIDFRIAEPGYPFLFPRDHGAHPEFKTEWWYFTGNLTAEGDEYGYELTFFREGITHPKAHENPSRWAVRNLYLAHFAITDATSGQFHFKEKISREALGKAGSERGGLGVWIDRWSVRQMGDEMHLMAEGNDLDKLKLKLKLVKSKSEIIHGKNGISKKGDAVGQASHYYSLTRLLTTGSLWIDGREIQVSGFSWMDHEFGSSFLAADQVGWDWFSIQMNDGNEVMLYRIRRKDGTTDPHTSGTWINPKGQSRSLTVNDFTLTPTGHWTSPESQGRYPVRWNIEIPSEGLFLTSTPLLDHQELMTARSTRVTYWEGASRFSGFRQGRPLSGRGYIELTGYAK